MSALLSGLTDRNSVVQKSFAFAMGHLVRVSRGLRWVYPLVCLCVGLFVLVCVLFFFFQVFEWSESLLCYRLLGTVALRSCCTNSAVGTWKRKVCCFLDIPSQNIVHKRVLDAGRSW